MPYFHGQAPSLPDSLVPVPFTPAEQAAILWAGKAHDFVVEYWPWLVAGIAGVIFLKALRE
ncbi:MAG: hypothetical protein WAL78_08560 [Candidatus Acidiferrales bacterium]